MGLDHSLAWPENLALSFVIAAVVVARRWTKVLVSDTTITWKMQGSTKQVFFIDNVMIHREQTGRFIIISELTFFTFFWIPIFPYSYKYYMVCPMCNVRYKLKKAEAMELGDIN